MTRDQFKEIFDYHFDTVRNYIYYRSGDSEFATDTAQDVFLKIWEKKIDPKKNNVAGLLYKIAGDLIINTYRKQKVANKFLLKLEQPVDSYSPAHRLQFLELQNKFELALENMPEKHRMVFLMSRIDNLKYYEIAEIIGISVKGVEKRMNYALSFLKKELNY